MKILVTGIGGPTPRSIVSVLRRAYPDASVVGVDCRSFQCVGRERRFRVQLPCRREVELLRRAELWRADDRSHDRSPSFLARGYWTMSLACSLPALLISSMMAMMSSVGT